MSTPKIRFRGFTGDWEKRKVSSLCSISTGKSNTQDKVDEGEYPFYVRSPIIERSTKYLYDEEAIITVGDGVGTGKVFHYVNGKYDLHQRCYRMYDFTDELNARYFYHIFSKSFYNRVMSMTAKTSVDSVRMDMIADMKIPTPLIKEQEKVGVFFNNLDNLITLHQRKCDSLKQVKKYMLQKMFPKQGEKVPEIRFAGFTGDWEQRKVLDVAPLQRGFDLPMAAMKHGNYPVVMSNGIGGYHSEYKAKGPGVITGRSGTIGKLHYVDSDYWPHNTALWVTDFKGNNPKFIYYLYDWLDLSRFGTGSGVPTLNRNDVHDTNVYIPVYEEQQKISAYLDGIDNFITLHQRKSDSLKEIKKFMLQNMFPNK